MLGVLVPGEYAADAVAGGETLGCGKGLVGVTDVGDLMVGDVGQRPGGLVLGEEDDAVLLGDLLKRVAAVQLIP
ncbi:hypothetical protein ABTX81_01610 [Kitasatospora sp. NPDC097605]|uniref:hypothetical protein n=1 Tax=Kitasatospora sp. NPDC097605 TaxID=3157226 RepID=UPI00332D4A40